MLTHRFRYIHILLLLLLTAGGGCHADTVDINLPIAVVFAVTDTGSSTTGLPDPTTISFSSAALSLGNALRISARANTNTFSHGAGPAIPATSLSWTTSGANGGTGVNGALNALSFTQLFQSIPNAESGSVDLTWSLAALPDGVHAGTHTLIMTWKVESIVP